MTFWRAFYHLIWSTKHRSPVIDERVESIVRRSIYGIADEHSSKVWAIGMMPDHVHVAISIPPKNAVSKVVNDIKGTTSHLLGHQYHNEHNPWPGWQSEYGMVTFSERSLQQVIDYVDHQREHHAANTLLGTYEREERDGYVTANKSEVAGISREMEAPLQ